MHWVFTAALMLSLVAESGGTLELWNAGLSLRWLLLLWSMGSRVCGLQQLQHTGLAAPWHVGSSQIKEWTISPSLAGKFFTTEPPAKSLLNALLYADLNSNNNFGYNSERLFTIYSSVGQGPAVRSMSGDSKVNYYLGSASTWRIYFQSPQAVWPYFSRHQTLKSSLSTLHCLHFMTKGRSMIRHWCWIQPTCLVRHFNFTVGSDEGLSHFINLYTLITVICTKTSRVGFCYHALE